jgi:hypothetical protein
MVKMVNFKYILQIIFIIILLYRGYTVRLTKVFTIYLSFIKTQTVSLIFLPAELWGLKAFHLFRLITESLKIFSLFLALSSRCLLVTHSCKHSGFPVFLRDQQDVQPDPRCFL